MKKIFFAAIFSLYLIPYTLFGQANSRFHDRIDTTIFAVADTVGHGANNYYATNLYSDFDIKKYLNGTTVNLFIKKGVTGTATFTLITKSGTLPTKAIKKANGQNLGIGDILDSSNVILTFYGTYWRLSGTPASATAWSLTGNAGTVDGTNFIGTTDNIPFNIRVNNQKSGKIDNTLGNVFMGYQSGNSNTTGVANSAFGHLSLRLNTTGIENIAIGQAALGKNTSGNSNIAIGQAACNANTNQSNNTAIGYNTLLLATANDNTAIGYRSLNINSTGNNNTAVGAHSLIFNTTGNNNTAIGDSSLLMNITGSSITTLGFQSNVTLSGLTNATAIGANAVVGASNALVLGNAASVGIGTSAPAAKLHITADGATSATYSLKIDDITTAVPLLHVRDDGYISAGLINGSLTIGSGSYFNSSILDNTFIGVNVSGAAALTTATQCTAIGSTALYSLTSGTNNVAIGKTSAYNVTSGVDNIAIGTLALSSNQTGGKNVAIGTSALANATSSYNIGIGETSLNSNTSGTENIGIGFQSGYFNATGSRNTIIGYNSGIGNANFSGNVFLGYNSGYGETGSDLLYIHNALIGTGTPAELKNGSLIWGNFNSDPALQTLTLNAKVGIGTGSITPTSPLTVNGGIQWTGIATTYTATGTYTVTAGELVGGLLIAATATATTTMQLPTATQIATQIGATKGTTYQFVLDNSGATNGTVTLLVGSGMSVSAYPTLADANELIIAGSSTTGIAHFELLFMTNTSCIIKRIS